VFGDLDDPASAVSRLVAAGATEVLHPEYAMGEKVTYRHLPKKFVAGTVILGDVDEVAIGAEVTVSGDGKTWTGKTNGFGDFEVEGLPANTIFTVKVAAPGYKAASCETKTSKDVYLGEIVLSR
jgi:hypothetical protein